MIIVFFIFRDYIVLNVLDIVLTVFNRLFEWLTRRNILNWGFQLAFCGVAWVSASVTIDLFDWRNLFYGIANGGCRCLISLRRQTPHYNYKIIFILNNSEFESFQLFINKRFPEVKNIFYVQIKNLMENANQNFSKRLSTKLRLVFYNML